MRTVLKTAPTKEPVTKAEAKDHLRISIDDDDRLLNRYILTARRYTEEYLGRVLIQQTWQYYLDDWPSKDYIILPYGKLHSVIYIEYTDTNSDTTIWSASEYGVDTYSDPGRVVLEYGYTWPSTTLHPQNPIEIQYKCGYGTTKDSVPEPIRQAILMLVGHQYEMREAYLIGQIAGQIQTVPLGYDALLQPYRIHWFGDPN